MKALGIDGHTTLRRASREAKLRWTMSHQPGRIETRELFSLTLGYSRER